VTTRNGGVLPRLLLASALAAHTANAQGANAQGASTPGRPPLRHYHHTGWRYGDEIPVAQSGRLMRSPDGYLWLASVAGVVRFDGVRFTVLDGRTTPALRPERPATGSYVPELVDHAGRLWIRRPDGALVTYEDGTFRVALRAAAGGVTYHTAYEDGAHTVWIDVDSAGLEFLRRLDGARTVPHSWPAGVPDSGVIAVVPDTADGMWVGTWRHGLWHVTPRGAERVAVPGPLRDESSSPRPIRQTRDGTLWTIGGPRGTGRLRGGRWSALPAGVGGTVGDVTEAPDGTVYLATRGGGLARLDGNTLESVTLGDGLTSAVTVMVTCDGAGTVWVLTDAGLDRLRPAAFATLDARDGLPPELVPYEVVPGTRGAIWVKAWQRDDLYRLDGGVAVGGPAPTRVARVAPIPGLYGLLGPSRDGGVWAGLRQGGVVHVRGVAPGGAAAFAAGLPLARVWKGVEGDDGALWVTLWPSRRGGVVRGGRFRAGGLPGVPDTARLEFREGPGRAVVSHRRLGGRAYLVGGAGPPRALPTAGIRRLLRSFAVAPGDTVWGAEDDGRTLVRFAGARAAEVRLPAAEPALADGDATLVVSGGALWVGSEQGVGRLPLGALNAAADGRSAAPAVQRFTGADGLAAPRLAAFAIARMARAPDGRVWLVTPAGLAVVDPTRLPVSDEPPRVYVEELEVDGRPLVRDTLAPGAALEVQPNPGRVAIRYTAASPRLPERVRLQYRLDGVDASWTDARGPRVATYTQLRPGRYRFRVRAWNEDGVPSRGEATLALRVRPLWYQTWWAGGLGAAAVGAAGAGAAWLVARARQRHREAELRAVMAERTRVARELHDTLLGSMTGVAMQLDAAAAHAARPGGVSAATLEDVRDQTYGALAAARRSVSDLRAAEADGPLRTSLEAAADRAFAGTDVDVRVEHVGRPRRYAPAVEAEVLRVVAEALTNARKHADCRRVIVTCAYRRRGPRLRVRDDGRGFDPDGDRPGGHWGLVGMRERAAAIGARLTVASAPGRGTDVVLDVDHP